MKDKRNVFSGKKKMQIGWGLLAGFLLVFLDQATKMLAVTQLKGRAAVEILPGIFELFYLENHGAAFGILQGQRTFFIISTSIVLILLILIYVFLPEEKKFFYVRALIVLLSSGALGNLIDRCRYNYVIDFFYFKLIDFPVFNVADIYVVLAACFFVLLFCFYYKEEDLDQLLAVIPFLKKKEKKQNE